MAVRKIFGMQNNFTQRRGDAEEGICTITALQWAKVCLMFNRGIGSYNQLQLTDHQRNGMMAVFRREDGNPALQTSSVGLTIVGGNDHNIASVEDLHQTMNDNAPHIGIFWNSFHTMGYRIGTWGKGKEYEWFDNNHGLYVSSKADEMITYMKNYMATNYGQQPSGARVVRL